MGKTISFVALATAFMFGVAVFATPFMYVGWNWGLVAVAPVRPAGLGNAFCLALLVSALHAVFTAKLKLRSE